MLTHSCPCAHHEDTWERGGTTPHIINPVLLHNMPFNNILATILSMKIFLLHNIPLPINWNRWLTHYIFWYPYFCELWFLAKPTNTLALSGTSVLHQCVWWPPTTFLYLWGKCPEYQLNRRLDWPVENLLTLPGTLPQLLIHLSRPQPAKHNYYTIAAPLLQSVLSWIHVSYL